MILGLFVEATSEPELLREACNWDSSRGLSTGNFFLRKRAVFLDNRIGLNESLWRPKAEGLQFEVILLRFDGRIKDSYRATLDKRSDKIIVLIATATKRLKINDFTIAKGDHIHQYFLFDEWFYIQEYRDSRGRLKGWYCNIGTPPEIKGSTITSRDLILDIFVDRARGITILDEDELRKKQDLMTASTLKKIEQARDRIVQMVKNRMLPFDHDVGPD
jgi:predicted RNA-binding protein associated with RNAse of E/G family